MLQYIPYIRITIRRTMYPLAVSLSTDPFQRQFPLSRAFGVTSHTSSGRRRSIPPRPYRSTHHHKGAYVVIRTLSSPQLLLP
jgi:hypothetical protein